MGKQATFRFHGALNDFLPVERRNAAFAYDFTGKPSVKDAVEALGAPHVEVNVITVNSVSVPFTAHLSDGDSVEVYPAEEGKSVSGAFHLIEPVYTEPTFILDVHLGKLARYLRLLGIDAFLGASLDDLGIVTEAARTGRIVLTRDVGLLKNGSVARGYWIRSRDPREQAREVVSRYGLTAFARPFSRCLVCNGIVMSVPKEEVAGNLPPGAARSYEEFHRCPCCRRVYWKGSHYERMEKMVGRFLNRSVEGNPEE
jgi:hypothetical protein